MCRNGGGGKPWRHRTWRPDLCGQLPVRTRPMPAGPGARAGAAGNVPFIPCSRTAVDEPITFRLRSATWGEQYDLSAEVVSTCSAWRPPAAGDLRTGSHTLLSCGLPQPWRSHGADRSGGPAARAPSRFPPSTSAGPDHMPRRQWFRGRVRPLRRVGVCEARTKRMRRVGPVGVVGAAHPCRPRCRTPRCRTRRCRTLRSGRTHRHVLPERRHATPPG